MFGEFNLDLPITAAQQIEGLDLGCAGLVFKSLGKETESERWWIFGVCRRESRFCLQGSRRTKASTLSTLGTGTIVTYFIILDLFEAS